MDKSKQYEKTIVINDQSQEVMIRSMSILINFMYNNSKDNNEFVEYFRLRLMDSVCGVNAKDLKLEWVTNGH